MNTPTPWTDANEEDGWNPCGWAVDSNLVRELERELIAARQELKAVTEQRDRLAEAFHDMLNDTLTPTNDEWIVTDNENYIEIASIKTCDSIASVHGGKTIGDQYDLAGRIARVPQLERELAAARQELKAVTEQRDKYHDYWESFGEERIKLKTELAAVTEQRDRLADLVRQFIYILDITEESDSGRLFHPTNITSCRAGDLQKAGELVEALRRASRNQPTP